MKNRFFPYHWFVDDSETEVTAIRVYGIGENNENICLRINDFTPYIYLELPTHIPWNESKIQLLVNKIDDILKDKKSIKKSLIWKYKLYGANINPDGTRMKFPYLFLSFSNKNDYKPLMYTIQKKNLIIAGLGAVKLKMHEQDADPILQLTTCRCIPICGWIEFVGTKIDSEEEKLTLCDLEYKVKWKNLMKHENPKVGLPKIMGFDIEVNSSNPNMMPRVEKPEDKIFNISCVFTRESSNEYTYYIITLGDPYDDSLGVENPKVIRCNNEKEIITNFTELIRTENPNIIVGYNILNFDIPYLINRSITPCNVGYIFDTLGFHKFSHAKKKVIKWTSSAYKNQEFEYLDAEGRLFIDLLPLVKRDFKMDNYKLKTVSDYFLGQTKDDLSVKGIFKCFRVGTKKEIDGTYSNKARKAISIVSKYCIKDSELVVKLMYKLQTWVGLSEMSNCFQVQPFTLFTQGQQIKVYSQVYKYCYENNIVVEKDGYICKEDERYTGAHVFPPVPGIYDRVVPFDFASLYPTTMIAYNIDYSTYVTDENIPDSKCHVFEWNDCISCIVSGSNVTNDNFGIDIEDLENNNNLILSHSETGNSLEYKKQLNFFNQGDKECIEIIFQDGSCLKCTPDHKIMTSDNEWIEAQNIILYKTKIKKSITYPRTKFNDYICDFEIIYGNINLNMKNVYDIQKFCKFSRLVGLMYYDGSIYCEDTVDINSIIRDIYDVCGKNPTCRYVNINDDDRYFHIIFPLPYDIRVLSMFLTDKNCPLILKREFLAGIFGKYRIDMVFDKNISLCFSDHPEYIQNIQNILKNDFDIVTSLDKNINLNIDIDDIVKFRDLIGFRHCTYKSFILEIICSYKKFIDYHIKISFQEYLEDLNVFEFSNPYKYNIPYYELRVIDIKNIGIQKVYDIEVDDNHSFLADGVVVHNCSHDPKIIRRNELTAYIDGEKEKIKKLREKRDDKKNKTTKQKIVDELNKKVEELKPYIEERTKVVKTISKNVMCSKRYYRFLKEPKGVIPTILQNLLDARKNTRKIIKENVKIIDKIVKENNEIILKKEDSDKLNSLKMLNNVLDKRQWAYKISANSVASTTPIPCKINGKFIYKTIEEISKGNWNRINEEQEVSEPIDNLEVWSDMGFTKVKFVMRHYTYDILKRIVTDSGIVTCTNDHSLLKPNGNEVKPSECKIGDELLHKECVSNLNYKNIINFPENGKSGFYKCSSEIKSAKIFNLIRKHGYNVKIDFENNIYIIEYSKLTLNITNNIKKIENVNNPQYVYDIETENHHFAAGVGNMIVHNSMYGSMGVKRGYLPFMVGAMVTTFMGRTNIEVVAKTIPEKYGGELVYGDQLVSVIYNIYC